VTTYLRGEPIYANGTVSQHARGTLLGREDADG
jgi:hypothetical protein